MLRREHQEVRAVDGVDAGGEDFDRVGARGSGLGFAAMRSELPLRDARIPSPESRQRELKPHASAFRPPNPVPLHRQHFVRPARQPIGGLQQLVGIVRDAEEPLLELASRDRRAAAPAAAIDDLLVGEHGVAARAPVDVRALAEREIALEHFQEEPLVPVVVIGQARGDLPVPRVADADPLELPLHVGDVLEGPGLRVHAALDGGVFGGQSEGIPAERMQDVEAAHALHARDDVADHVVADVSNVGVAGGVREHLQAIELRPGVVFSDLEDYASRCQRSCHFFSIVWGL